jgi:hypothetical protein
VGSRAGWELGDGSWGGLRLPLESELMKPILDLLGVGFDGAMALMIAFSLFKHSD